MIDLKKLIVFFAVCILLCGCSKKEIYIPDTYSVSGEVAVTFFDMEYGACTLIDAEKSSILIGCGGADDFPLLYEYLRSKEVNIINALILPGETAYTGGFQKIAANFDVEEVYVPENIKDIAKYRTISNLAADDNSFYVASDGTRIYDKDGLYIDVISSGVCSEEAFLSLYITYGETSFFLEGNGDFVAERQMLLSGGELIKADVISVPHCGTKYLPSEEFLEAVTPAYAVIPVYGECTPQLTLQKKITERGTEILRTDTDGTITFVSDGKKVKSYHKK